MIRHPHALLDAYLDQELPLGQTRQVAQHLETCAVCRAEFDTLLAMRQLLTDTAALPLIDVEAKMNAQRFWQALAPKIVPKPSPKLPAKALPDASPHPLRDTPQHGWWWWGAGMVIVTALTQLVMVAGVIVSLGHLFGIPLSQWLGLGALRVTLPLPAEVLRSAALIAEQLSFFSGWLGALFTSSASSLLPYLFGFALSAALALLSVTWLWAALQRYPASGTASGIPQNTAAEAVQTLAGH